MDQDQVDWLELPDHILYLIAVKSNRIKDYIRFGAVCHSWQSIFTENRHPMSHEPPLLLLGTELNHDNQTGSLYSLAHKRVVDSQVQVPHNRHCPGSSHGWLVIINKDWDISLLNPFLSVNNQILLPSVVRTFPNHPERGSPVGNVDYYGYVVKIVLSANPTSNPNYVAMAIYSDLRYIAFCKAVDKVWTVVDSEYSLILDVVYYEDRFYFVDHKGTVSSCDLNHPQPKVLQVAPVFDPPYADMRTTHFESDLIYYNSGFSVFKLDRVGIKWIQMNNLHGHALFVGDNTSYSISASDFTKCKPNSIYFTDDLYEGYYDMVRDRTGGPHDIGVFNLEDSTRELFYSTDTNVFIPAPIWIEPRL
ncbi:hypothetical protein AQUCO_02500192v1 [Aquilegia coerulea]|uniref:KIB1-4 beta-propeller domain-containing protein n=1 Tax=Aquilegia coerulea TaxID=218851 RepID=A0A2G5D9W9_AQUCA|nr:hypothetical protein AQUCO_02500192v1 [Aquilegia coerulea]